MTSRPKSVDSSKYMHNFEMKTITKPTLDKIYQQKLYPKWTSIYIRLITYWRKKKVSRIDQGLKVNTKWK